MIFKVRILFFLLLFLLFSWIGWLGYSYFFDKDLPVVQINGLEDNAYYAGEVQCAIVSNKSGAISIWLDDNPLVNKFSFSRRNQEHSFKIPTKTLTDGKHAIKIEVLDGSYSKNKVVLNRTFYVDNVPLQAAIIKPQETDAKVLQGRTLHLQFQANKEIKEAKVYALSNTYDCVPESKRSTIYESFIPITCDEVPNEYLLTIEGKDHVGNKVALEHKFQIVGFPFKKQTITVEKGLLEKEKELSDASGLEDTLKELAQKSPKEKLWRGEFCTPIDIKKITCEFGTIRTTQEKGRYTHKAVDVIAPPKTVVWATQDGIVVVKNRFSNSGNTVVLDHGCGVLSLFFHLDSLAPVNVGDKVAKGNPIGTLGKTGYATGYHLHWEMRVNNIQVDPLQWTMPSF